MIQVIATAAFWFIIFGLLTRAIVWEPGKGDR